MNYLRNLFIFILTIAVNACGIRKFSEKREGTDIVLNGTVERIYLNNPKKFPWFYYGYQAYQANDTIIKQLQPEAKKLGLLIFAGSWCGDTQKELPAFFKVADLIGLKEEQIQIIMVDKKKQTTFMNPSVLGVKPVPCFIVYRDNIEIGRIIESSKVSIEHHLLEIIKSSSLTRK